MEPVPQVVTTAHAVGSSTAKAVVSTTSDDSFTSDASIFLPRYSGVRPTIKPAIKMATKTKMSMVYRPDPTPPKITSPNSMLSRGINPAIGVNESCMEMTAPQPVAVVMLQNRAELNGPKRVSFPSILLLLDVFTPPTP